MMNDVLTTLEGSLVHHGPDNDRAYLLKLEGEPEVVAERLEKLASDQGYSKIIAKVPEKAREEFSEAGFEDEASIPGYYRRREDAHFMVKYLSQGRRRPQNPEQVKKVLAAARARRPERPDPAVAKQYDCRVMAPGDAEAMAEVYREVFASYPFPIHDPDYLRQTMAENIVYFGLWDGDRLAALSSAEMDASAGSAEMTDFATLPDYRGAGLATFLLSTMEREMRQRGVKTVFTIARAVSFGMNLTFAKLSYEYGGTLTCNTNISGSMECMNVWHKSLT